MKFKTKPKKPRRDFSPGLAAVLREIAEERVQNGFRNEALLIQALREDPEPGEKLPAWFCGTRAATRNEDLHSGIDLFVRVWVKGRDGVPQRVGVPVNAKSSEFGAEMFQKHSRHANGRRKRHAIPIVPFVVDRFVPKPKLREKFFAELAAHGELRAWLGRSRLSFHDDPPERTPPKPRADRERVARARASLEEKIAGERVLRLRIFRQKVRAVARSVSRKMAPGPARGATAAAIVALAEDRKLLRAFEATRERVEGKVREAIANAHRESAASVSGSQVPPDAVAEKCAQIFAKSWRTIVPEDGTTLHVRRFLREARIAARRALRQSAAPA